MGTLAVQGVRGARNRGRQDGVRGQVRPSYGVDQKFDEKLTGPEQRNRLAQINEASKKRVKIPRQVAPYAQQLLGMAFLQDNPTEVRVQAIQILGRLNRQYAEPAELDLPKLIKDKNPDVRKAAKEAKKRFEQSRTIPPRQRIRLELPRLRS